MALTIASWDIDFDAFIDLKKKQGDDRARGHNLYIAIAFDDVFMSRLEKYITTGEQQYYTLFDPYDVKELCDLYGEEFKKRYLELEEEFKNNPKNFNPNTSIVSVKEMAVKLMQSLSNTGFPYFTFIDTINDAHRYKQLGKIRTGNLCVHGDTKILTNKGYKVIRNLENELVKCWNGKSWEDTLIVNTGSAIIYNVEFYNCPTLRVTEEHKFYVVREVGNDKIELKLSTKELKRGDKIISFELPSEDLMKLLEKNQTIDKINSLIEDVNKVNDRVLLGKEGWYFAFRAKNGKSEDLYIALSEAGIQSRIKRISNSLVVVFVKPKDFFKLYDRGLVCKRDFTKDRYLEEFSTEDLPCITVLNVVETKTVAETYCGKEPKEEKLFFNGIITGNCQEVVMPADDDEIAVCNLGSLNFARINGDEELLRKTSKALARFLDNSVDTTTYPHPDAEKTQRDRRALGGGILGEAEYLAKNQIHFGSEEHLKEIDRLYKVAREAFEETSRELAEEKGSCVIPGVRNAYLMCIAPNTSTGLFASTTSGIEPVYGKIWVEEKSKVRSRMTAPNIDVDSWEYYKNAFQIDPYKMIDATSKRQEYIDMSISHSLFLDMNGFSMMELIKLYIYAWKKKLKTVYYLRTKPAENDINDIEISCASCAN